MSVLLDGSHAQVRNRLDRSLFVAFVSVGLVGVAMIYSATRDPLLAAGDDPAFYLKRQLIFVSLGVVVMYLISRIDIRRLEIVTTPFYVASVLSLIAVRFFGSSALGAQRWFDLKLFQVQPSEFAVLALILSVATYCARRPEGLAMRDVGRMLCMATLPLILIFFQPDLGTVIIIVLVIAVMLVIAGVPPRLMVTLAVGGIVVVLLGVYLQILHKYQIGRFTAFINQSSSTNDPNLQALIYHVSNAKNAIGAGGITGSGFFHGLQTTLGYVPEQRTDFIFSAIGEQVGFVGSSIVLALLAFVSFRIFVASRDAKDRLGQLLCVGIFVFFSFSCFQNIGMTMGIMPVTGIPLPLISYGGSAAIVFFAAGGVVLSVTRRLGS